MAEVMMAHAQNAKSGVQGAHVALDDQPDVSGRNRPFTQLSPPATVPILFVAALYLLATGRWGSYLGIPGIPVYVGDILVASAVVQTLIWCRRAAGGWTDACRSIGQAPLALLLALCLLAWTLLRGLVGIGDIASSPLVALRDLAPYGYAIAAVLAFLLPTADGKLQRRLIYAALGSHVAWILLGPHVTSATAAGPLLGGTPIFTTRPDFDSAVLGVGIAFALRELTEGRRFGGRKVGSLALFIGASAYAISTQPTRAGLLAGLICIGAVGLIWIRRRFSDSERRSTSHVIRQVAIVVIGCLAVIVAVAVSPPGQRLLDGLSNQGSQAAGTADVRRSTWTEVYRYVTASPTRVAVGVGFGPDFIDASGTSYSLQGTLYKDVRSPHNYVIGTFARLGTIGGLLALLLIATAFYSAVRVLLGRPGPATTLASLVLLALPVTAMLGVVFESPFGAIPYFWAVGQVARAHVASRTEMPGFP
jgi:hypothetical protein